MSGLLTPILDARGGGALLVAAAPAEAGAILAARGADEALRDSFWRRIGLADRLDMVVCGVGKANAAAATARTLDLDRDCVVISLGVGGALPGAGLALGQAALGSRSVMADEGVEAEESFLSTEALGFPARLGPGGPSGPDGRMGVEPDGALAAALRPAVDRESVIATVSTCSGTDARAMAIATRTGAAVEAMEGAAVGLAAWNLAASMGARGPAFAEIRVVSNTAGARSGQRWDLAGALAALARIAAAL